MPKIIENLENKLMEEARRQIETIGYAATTIRSVAAECGVGVGTVYNYFSSKDDLAAAYLLEDWKTCIAAICTVSAEADSPKPVVQSIFQQLRLFSQRHQAVFQDQEAAASFTGSFSRYHGLLRSQLAAPLEPFCDSRYSAQFIAEALLTWTMAGTEFDDLYGMIGKLF